MGLFNKNPNETAYAGGKKHFTDVIKNTGPSNALIWRQPEEDFNTNSTLIVMPGEKAIFIKGGTIEQVFDNGTYKLSTENYPFISRLRNVFTGGISIFNCVVYFVNSTHGVEIRWGTDSPIQVRDKRYGIPTELRCRGSYKITVDNPAIFLEKLVGNNVNVAYQDQLYDYFVSEFQSKIKSVITRAINNFDAELLGIDAHLDELSDIIQPSVQEILDAYGLRCVKFTVSAIDIVNNELRQKHDRIIVDAFESKTRTDVNAYESKTMAIADAIGKREAMNILGDDWGKQQSAEILHDLANNPGTGGIGAMGAGLGVGIAASPVFYNMANQMLEPMSNTHRQTTTPVDSPAGVPSGRFTQQSTSEQTSTPVQTLKTEDPRETLAKLKQMLDEGLIEQADYDAKKSEVLSRM